MKTKPYVAIHFLKALSYRIVRQTSKNVFFKGPVSKLHIKISAFTAHLSFKVQGSFKVKGLACSVLWKMLVHINSLRWSCRAPFFQSKMCKKLVPGLIWLRALYFERALHEKIRKKFRCEHCSFKVWVHWCCGLWKNIVGHTEISVFAFICLHLQKLFTKM